MEEVRSAVVLLSSGLDSTVNLYCARRELNISKAITFNYGQRAARREIEHSQKICKVLNIEHNIIEILWLGEWTSTSLVNTKVNVPQGEEIKIDDYQKSLKTAKAVWVPNRNGIFLNIAAALAESLEADYVIPGFNKEEAVTFPDNTQEYLDALENCFSFSTASKVKTLCFTADKNKSEIVQLGRKLQVPFDLMWPCYLGEEKICQKCESCKRFLGALEA
ncbi:MAG: 7-cyano-7-deazaguanine synthase QueC [Bdellovibrionales bacterium RBG_16_40_8]|nr:MAG: 7-cyano-7-deazaguanine synthase QueC [Bdellovibrionales bacterium RBG_16_40_8]